MLLQSYGPLGWLYEAKVSCILLHRGVQLILAYSRAKSAVLAVGKVRGGMFLFLLFLHCHLFSFLPCSSLLSSLLSLFSLSLGDDTKWTTRVDVSLNPNTINGPHQAKRCLWTCAKLMMHRFRDIPLTCKVSSAFLLSIATLYSMQ